MKLSEAIQTSNHLIAWSDYCGSKRRMTELGLSYIVDALESGSLAREEMEPQFFYSLYQEHGTKASEEISSARELHTLLL